MTSAAKKIDSVGQMVFRCGRDQMGTRSRLAKLLGKDGSASVTGNPIPLIFDLGGMNLQPPGNNIVSRGLAYL